MEKEQVERDIIGTSYQETVKYFNQFKKNTKYYF